MRALFVTVLLCCGLAMAAGQPAPKKPSATSKAKRTASPPGRSECVEAVGLCVTVPAAWQRLGNIFDDLGFVVAEQHVGVDSATWPQINVAAIDLPSPKGGASAPSLDSLMDIVLTPDGTFTSTETQQRTRLLLNGANAQVIRVKLHSDSKDPAAQADSVEEVALIEGDAGLVYSIALRCAPQDVERLEPIFQKVIHSWRFKAPAEPNAPAELKAPAEQQSAPPAKSAQDPDKK